MQENKERSPQKSLQPNWIGQSFSNPTPRGDTPQKAPPITSHAPPFNYPHRNKVRIGSTGSNEEDPSLHGRLGSNKGSPSRVSHLPALPLSRLTRRSLYTFRPTLIGHLPAFSVFHAHIRPSSGLYLSNHCFFPPLFSHYLKPPPTRQPLIGSRFFRDFIYLFNTISKFYSVLERGASVRLG